MSRDDIVRALREMLPPKVDYAELVASPVPSSYGVCYVWEDPEPYQISAAIDLIESLTAENARLRTERDEAQRRARAAVEDMSQDMACGLCFYAHVDVDAEPCRQCRSDRSAFRYWRGAVAGEESR